MVTVKQTLDQIFDKVNFDTALYKKLVHINVDFITKNPDHKSLFGSKLIGCQYVKYTHYDKSIFYDELFGLDYDHIVKEISHIRTIPSSFKVARDDINLVCFYTAYRFLTNKELSQDKRTEYAKEILTYFSYRTLVLLCSNYFVYPISEEKALTLSERLSNKYLIKRLKNWNEYCIYRSEEYLESKYESFLLKFDQDKELPNAINDLYGRTKDTIKTIYREFIDMTENDEIIQSRKNVINNLEGQSVFVDKLNTPDSYFTKLEPLLTEKERFIRKDYVDVVVSMVQTVSHKQMTDCLTFMLDYSYLDRKRNDEVKNYVREVLVTTIDYLQKNNVYLNKSTNVVEAINYIIGNILFARGTDIEVNKVKEEGERLVKNIYKHGKTSINDRYVKFVRNGLYVYIVLLALT